MASHLPTSPALTDSHSAQFATARAGLGIAVVQLRAGEAQPDLVCVLPEYLAP